MSAKFEVCRTAKNSKREPRKFACSHNYETWGGISETSVCLKFLCNWRQIRLLGWWFHLESNLLVEASFPLATNLQEKHRSMTCRFGEWRIKLLIRALDKVRIWLVNKQCFLCCKSAKVERDLQFNLWQILSSFRQIILLAKWAEILTAVRNFNFNDCCIRFTTEMRTSRVEVFTLLKAMGTKISAPVWTKRSENLS